MNTNTLSPPTTRVIWRVTSEQMERARTFAQRRKSGHDHCRTRSQEIGANGFLADLVGVLGELLPQEALVAAGYSVKDSALAADRPVCKADFVLHGTRYDCKAIGTTKRFACVNEAWLQKMREDVDKLLFVKFTDIWTAFPFAPVPLRAVLRWPLRQDRHAPYRSVAVESLTPLRSLHELREASHARH